MFTLKKGRGGGIYVLNETSACVNIPLIMIKSMSVLCLPVSVFIVFYPFLLSFRLEKNSKILLFNTPLH